MCSIGANIVLAAVLWCPTPLESATLDGVAPSSLSMSSVTQTELQSNVGLPGLGASGFTALVNWLDATLEDDPPSGCAHMFAGLSVKRSTLRSAVQIVYNVKPRATLTTAEDTFRQRADEHLIIEDTVDVPWDVLWKWQGISLASGVYNASAIGQVNTYSDGTAKYKVETNVYCDRDPRLQVTQYIRFSHLPRSSMDAVPPANFSDIEGIRTTTSQTEGNVSLSETGFTRFFPAADAYYQAAFGRPVVLDDVNVERVAEWEIELECGDDNPAFFSLQEKFLFNDSIGVFNNHAYKSELSLKLDHTALASSTTAHDMARQVLAYISDGYLVPRGLNGTAACSEMWPDIVEACSDSSQSGFHRRAYVWAIVAIGGVVLGTLVLTCVLLALHKYYNVRREAVNVSHSVKLTTTL